MAGVMYLGNQMVTPVITVGEKNPFVELKNGVLTKHYGDENGTSFPGIVELGPYSMKEGYYRYNSIYGSQTTPSVGRKISFPDLKKAGMLCLDSCFSYQYDVKELSVPLLEEVDEAGLSAFAYHLNDFYCCFDSLYKIGYLGFARFAYSFENSILIFPALKPEHLVYEDLQFSSMFYYGENNVVYFPSSVESIMGNWSYVISGMGGTDTTVVFRIPTQISITLINENSTILTNYKKVNNTILSTDETSKFVISNSSLNKNYLAVETNCIENERRSISIDLNSFTYNKITLNIAEPSLSNISCSWNGITLPLIQESENVYSIYVNSSIGETLTVDVAATNDHASVSAEITTIGQDIEETIVLPEYQDFVRPNLTSNGTLGGDSFAVKNPGTTTDDNVYKAFDGDENTYWEAVNGYGDYAYCTIYNPEPVGAYSFVVKCTDTSHRVNNCPAIFAGIDNAYEVQLGASVQTSGSTCTIDVLFPTQTGNRFFKYFYLILGGSTTKRITEIEIDGKVVENGS